MRRPKNMRGASSEYRTHLPTSTLTHGHGGLFHRDILFQILVRLGAKSRGKLSCVSKCFRTILTDPRFVEFQRNWSAARNHGTTIRFSIQTRFMADPPWYLMFNSTPEQFYTISYEENQNGEFLQASVWHTGKGCSQDGKSVSFAKDQICFFNKHLKLMIFNLITGQHTTLLATPSRSRHTCAFLGYDGVSGTYKVLKADANWRTVKYWVFTLGVDETWREIKSPVFFFLSISFTHSVCINGVIYSYNVLRSATLGGCSELLVAFDVRSESFHLIPLPPETYAKDVIKSSVLELGGQFAVINVHQNKQIIVWTLQTAAKSPSRWKKRVFPFPLDKEILEAGSEFFSKTSITATSAGEIVLLKLNGIPSLWVLSNKLGAGSVWKKFRIKGIAECSTCVKISSQALLAQNIPENLFHLE